MLCPNSSALWPLTTFHSHLIHAQNNSCYAETPTSGFPTSVCPPQPFSLMGMGGLTLQVLGPCLSRCVPSQEAPFLSQALEYKRIPQGQVSQLALTLPPPIPSHLPGRILSNFTFCIYIIKQLPPSLPTEILTHSPRRCAPSQERQPPQETLLQSCSQETDFSEMTLMGQVSQPSVPCGHLLKDCSLCSFTTWFLSPTAPLTGWPPPTCGEAHSPGTGC